MEKRAWRLFLLGIVLIGGVGFILAYTGNSAPDYTMHECKTISQGVYQDGVDSINVIRNYTGADTYVWSFSDDYLIKYYNYEWERNYDLENAEGQIVARSEAINTQNNRRLICLGGKKIEILQTVCEVGYPIYEVINDSAIGVRCSRTIGDQDSATYFLCLDGDENYTYSDWDFYCNLETEFCGDGICNLEENCSSCPEDCGICIEEPVSMCPDNQRIIRLSNVTNAYGQNPLFNGLTDGPNSNIYNTEVCYSDSFGENYTEVAPHNCNGENGIIWLADETESLASINSSAIYDTQICYGNISCNSRDICEEGEETLISLIDLTDSRIALGDGGIDYPFKICCLPTPREIICDNDGICEADETAEGCITDCTPACGAGKEWCLDGTCQDSCEGENQRDCDGGNLDGICNVTESCRCGDCFGEQDHCTNGLFCSESRTTCELASDAYWSTASDNSNPIDEISINDDGGEVLMNLLNTDLEIGQEVDFEIYYNQVGEDYLLKSITATADETSRISVTWEIDFMDILNKEDEDFYFVVEGIVSLPALKIEILDECFSVDFCSNYNTVGSCNQDSCGVGEGSVENNNPEVSCGVDYGEYIYDCGCEWDAGECGSIYERRNLTSSGTPFNEEWIGECFFSESSGDDCSDEFLEYSYDGIWRNGLKLTSLEASNLDLTGIRHGDFVYQVNSWYYDPETTTAGTYESDQCKLAAGSKTIPCPSQLKIPFFGFWNLIGSLSLLTVIYLWMIMFSLPPTENSRFKKVYNS
ncbi:hypothetical protein HN832_01575 [archaeon]|jgi:hypothetical protein|nr:hypothetical protein [archaeon]MBT4373926.1 hypothetical protein [archaeon]MBT4532319.1 hypothetical protein [archaeon]MBT7001905.1 hypothetical protein [archaeon]MBT7282082.1 hypothetical protein [archaeon]